MLTGPAVFIVLLAHVAIGQHSTTNSLQEAIEALHRHHEILSSQEHGRRHEEPRHYSEVFDDYFSDDANGSPGKGPLNRAVADYLLREEERERLPLRFGNDEDVEGELVDLEAQKRSNFRERAGKPPSVFRKQYAVEPDLGQEFLEEMEREREEEEEQQYQQTLHRLWNKYLQQENSIERQLFEERQGNDNEEELNDEEKKRKRDFNLDDRKKRYGYLPMYIGPLPVKRRDYPLLPWLTNDDDSRKKRFPVRKRSAKPIAEDQKPNASGTSAKVSNDLQTLFGDVNAKKKRSTEDELVHKATEEAHKADKKKGHEYKEPEEEEEDEEETEHEHDPDHNEHEGDDSEEEEDDEDRKKKRDVSVKSAPEVVKDEQIIPGDLTDLKKKKNAGWDKYFGYDRRKKKRSDGLINGKYQSMIQLQRPDDSQVSNEGDAKRKKKQMDPEKLDSMDEKLKNIEDLIIDETVKYTGAHEGVSSPEKIQKLKDHVISRLATAYSLEKMRIALDQLRENVDTERHLLHNEIEPTGYNADEEVKKMGFADKNNQLVGKPLSHKHLDQSKLDDMSQQKRKRNGLELDEDVEMNSVFECPLLNAMERRCRGVDILSGDIHQELLPVCAAHQLCYLCGGSPNACDLKYLANSNAICGPNKDCYSAAMNAINILRGSPGPHFGRRECARNPCLYNAIREFDN